MGDLSQHLTSSWSLSGKVLDQHYRLLLGRTRKFPTPLLFYSLLSLLGPSKHQKVSPDQGQGGAECDKATQHICQTDRLRPRHKDTLPRSFFARKRTVAFLQFFQGVGERSGNRRGVSGSFQLAKFRLANAGSQPK